MEENRIEPVWTRPFVFLCMVQFLAYANHAILTPTFPLYMTRLGGSALQLGLLMGAFSASSVVVRPLIGYWADRWGEVRVLTLGSVGMALCALIFLVPRIDGLFIGNALRGIAWAGAAAGGYSHLAHIVPPARRGEASGYYGGVQSSPNIFFPALALWMLQLRPDGFAEVFLVSAALSASAGVFSFLLQRAAGDLSFLARRKDAGGQGKEQSSRIFDPSVLSPAGLLLCFQLPNTAMTSFLVLYAQEIGVGGLGWYFAVSGSTTLLARPLLGRVSDRIGRGRSVVVGFVLQLAAISLLLLSSSLFPVVTAGALFTAGSAIGTTTTMALAMERANPESRGVTMASFSLAFPAGYGLGSVLAGVVARVAGYRAMYMVKMLIVALGLLFALRHRLAMDRPG